MILALCHAQMLPQTKQPTNSASSNYRLVLVSYYTLSQPNIEFQSAQLKLVSDDVRAGRAGEARSWLRH